MRLNANVQAIASAAVASSDIINHGVNAGTAYKDDRAWSLWEKVCSHFNTSPLRSAADVRDHPERTTFLLTSLMMYVRLYCRPKRRGYTFIKPKSCLAYPLAIIRIYKRWGINLPGYKQLLACLAGMCRRYVEQHGPNSLTPNKVEPMKFTMARAIFDLPNGAETPNITWLSDSHFTFIFQRANLFSMNTGSRVAAIAAGCSPNERTHITRADIHYTLSNTVFMTPSVLQLQSMRDGDVVTIRPPRAKCDQWLEIHAHFPHTFTFHSGDKYNVARAIRDIEIRVPCEGSNRESFALFGDASGKPYSSQLLNTALREALTHLYGPKVASIHTWHSYRSGLASALHAAGTPESVIMNICHWLSPDSIRSYRRISHQEQDSALCAAANMPIALLQPNHAPVVDADVHYAAILAGLQPNTTVSTVTRTRTQPRATHTAPNLANNNHHVATPCSQRTPPTIEQRADKGPTNASLGSLSPALDRPPAIGERVIVRRSLWPSYACHEHSGLGWEALVRSTTGATALLQFTHATTNDGRTYQNVRLPFNALHPLPGTAGKTNGPRGPRGGCNGSAAGSHAPRYEQRLTPKHNSVGYPQLVHADKCALCKTPLAPITQCDRDTRGRPTAHADRERLQCERCGNVRYCDAWCAHVHYVTCHYKVCPLPPFNRNFNAEYVERRGWRTRVIPIRAIRTSLINDGPLNIDQNAPGLARTHVWTVIKHHRGQCLAEACPWCTRPPSREPSSDTAPLLHHVWFTALITRIRGTGNSRTEDEFAWAKVPKWAPPLVIYPSAPATEGDPRETWPIMDKYSRVLAARPCGMAYRADDGGA